MANHEQQFGFASPQAFCLLPLSQSKPFTSPPSGEGRSAIHAVGTPRDGALYSKPSSALLARPHLAPAGGEVAGPGCLWQGCCPGGRRWEGGPCRGCSSPGHLPPAAAGHSLLRGFVETHGWEGAHADRGTLAGREHIRERLNCRVGLLSRPVSQKFSTWLSTVWCKKKFLLQRSKTQLFPTAFDVEKDAGLTLIMLQIRGRSLPWDV